MARMCVSCRFFRLHQHEDPAQPHHCDYVNAPIGDQALRLDCPEYEMASSPKPRNRGSGSTTGDRRSDNRGVEDDTNDGALIEKGLRHEKFSMDTICSC